MSKKLEKEIKNKEIKLEATKQVAKKEYKKSSNYFARTGRTLGIVAICTFFMIIPGLAIGIPGIVMSCIGAKADNEIDRHKSKVGKVLSILAVVLSFAAFIVLVVVIPVYFATRS